MVAQRIILSEGGNDYKISAVAGQLSWLGAQGSARILGLAATGRIT
jgi:hypothetical protein